MWEYAISTNGSNSLGLGKEFNFWYPDLSGLSWRWEWFPVFWETLLSLCIVISALFYAGIGVLFARFFWEELATSVAYIVRCRARHCVRLQTGSYRAISAHGRRRGLSGSLWEGRLVQDPQRGGQPRASDVAHPSASCVARPTHRSKATRDWKKANFWYPELGWLPQSPDLAPMDKIKHLAGSASSGAFFVEGCSQSSHCPCICCGRGGQCVQKSPSAVSRCRRRPFRGMILHRCCIPGASQKIL